MKYLLILFICFLVSLSSCSDDDLFEGTVSAVKNGDAWTPEPNALRFDQTGRLKIQLIEFGEYGITNSLFFGNVPVEEGLINLSVRNNGLTDIVTSSYSIDQESGHVAGDFYHLDTSDQIDDYLMITKIDGREMEATFQASYVLDTIWESVIENAPERIEILNGSFHLKWKEEE